MFWEHVGLAYLDLGLPCWGVGLTDHVRYLERTRASRYVVFALGLTTRASGTQISRRECL